MSSLRQELFRNAKYFVLKSSALEKKYDKVFIVLKEFSTLRTSFVRSIVRLRLGTFQDCFSDFLD